MSAALKLSQKFPRLFLDPKKLTDPAIKKVIQTLVRALEQVHKEVVRVVNHNSRAVRPLSTNHVTGTGTAGVDNTAQDVVTIVVAANTLTQVGDRIRIRCFWTGDTGGGVTGTTKLNSVTLTSGTDSGGTTFQEQQAYLHYVDDTHANIIAYVNGVLDTSISAANVSGFDWDADQNFIISQNAVANNHIIVYFFAADIFPK